jgi:general secretion pathway protein F
VFRAVLEAGTRSGQLAIALEGFANAARRAAALRQAIGTALIYPVLVLTVVCGLSYVVLTRLADLLVATRQPPFETSNPFVDRAIPWVSFVGNWLWVLAPLVMLLALFWWIGTGSALALQPRRFGAWMSWLPWAGKLLRHGRRAAFGDVLALLLEQQVPLPEALRLAAAASGDPGLEVEAGQLASSIDQGRTAVPTHSKRGAISPLVRWQLTLPSNLDQLVAALRASARAEQRRAEYLADWLRVQVPVMLTVGIGGTVTLLYALCVLAPWYGVLREFAAPV